MGKIDFIQTESYQRGAMLSVVFNVVAKALVFLLTVLIAHYFGSSIKTDIYFFVFSTATLLSGLTGAIDVAVLIPTAMRIKQSQSHEKANNFLGSFFILYSFLGLLFLTVIYVGGVSIFKHSSKFLGQDIELYKNYFCVGAVYLPLIILTNYFTSILTSLKYFTVPMTVSVINSLFVITAIVLLHKNYDVYGILFAGGIAYLFNCLLLLLMIYKVLGASFFAIKNWAFKLIWRDISYATIGQIATTFSSYLPLFLLSGYSGVISQMNYGKAIADVPNSLLTTQLTNVAGIKLNADAAKHQYTNMNNVFLTTSKALVFSLTPISIFLIVFAQPIITILYANKVFTNDAIKTSTLFLQLFASTVIVVGINAIVARVFFAMQLIKQSIFYQIIMNSILFVAIYSLIKYFGVYGYPYGLIVMNVINFIALYYVCKKLTPFLQYNNLLQYTLLVLLFNGVIVAITYVCYIYLPFTYIVKLLAASIIYIALLLIANAFFKINTSFNFARLWKILKK